MEQLDAIRHGLFERLPFPYCSEVIIVSASFGVFAVGYAFKDSISIIFNAIIACAISCYNKALTYTEQGELSWSKISIATK